MASRQSRGNAGPRQQQHRTARRSLLPALEVPNSPYKEAAPEQHSPAALLPVDAAAKQLILQNIDDFVLQLPLGTDRTSADIEAAVAAELLDLHLANYQLKQRLVKWTSATQELQDLVQEQQCEIRQLQGQLQQSKQQHEQQQQLLAAASKQQQLEAINAELQQQLQGATGQLQEMESAMAKIMEQQSLGANLEASKLLAERDAAATQLVEARSTATAAQQDAARLRRALLDAEIDTQRASVAADSARQKVAELEAELTRTRAQVAAAKAEAESHQRQLAAAASAAAASSAQLLQAQAELSKAQLDAAKARQDVEQQLAAVKLQCQGCAEKAGQILILQDELQGMKASNIQFEMAVQQEQRVSRGLTKGLEECRAELDEARGELAEAARARDQLYVQLYGGHSVAAGGGDAIPPGGRGLQIKGVQCSATGAPLSAWDSAAGSAGHSPVKHASIISGAETQQQQQQRLQHAQPQQPGQEGLIQKCSVMQSQLQQQGTELCSLRQQLLELQLQLSDAQSAADIATRRLQQSKAELASTKIAEQQAAAAATNAKSAAEQVKFDLLQAQVQLQQQSSDLAAATVQLERLEAQQKVLLSDMQEAMDAAAAATAAEAAAVAKAEGLQKQLAELQLQHDSAQQQWQAEQAELSQAKDQLLQQLSVAEAAACTAVEKVAEQHQQQIQQLTADHVVRVDMLRGELAADATHRASSESKLQALQLEHTKQLAEAHAESQQARAQQQLVQKSLNAKDSEAQQLSHKLAKAEEALAAAKHEAEAQLAAASKAQQALRQQLLEVRGERLQLQEKLTALQSSSGSGQQLVQQMLAAQQDAAALAGQLRQQLQHAQAQLQEQQKQLQALQSEKASLEQYLAEAVAAKEAAARQAAAAGEKLAVSVAAQEALKLQVEAVRRDVARQSWDQQQQQPTYNLPGPWQPQQVQHNPLYAGSAAGSQASSPAGSPYRAAQLERTRQQLNKLAQTLAERDAELNELNSELKQAQAENQQLFEQQKLLKAELAILQGRSSRSHTQGLQRQLAQSAVAEDKITVDDCSAGKVQYALTELAQLTVAMEALERRLAQQAAANSRAPPNFTSTAVSAAAGAALSGSPANSSGSASPAHRCEALVAAAIAVADLRWEVRRLSTELREEERTEQLQLKLHGAVQPMQQVHSLQNMVRQLSTELTEKKSLLATLPELHQQLSDLSAQLQRNEREATDVATLREQLADLRQQLAAAQAQARAAATAAAAAGAASSSGGWDDSAKLSEQVADLQQQLVAAKSEARAAAAAAAAADSSVNGRNDSATLQTLLSELMQLKQQLDDATARDAGAAAEAAQLKLVVQDLQSQLQASQAAVQQLEAAQAAAEAVKEKLQAELRFLQAQFEDVIEQLHNKEEQLQLQQAQVTSLQKQLADAEAGVHAKLEQQKQQLLTLQQQLANAQAQEVSSRAELAAARQKLQHLQEQVQQQQQEQAEEPSGTARKMQALLMQKDRDIQKLQQQLQDQQLQVEQLSEQLQQLQLQQSLPPSAWLSAAGADASAMSDSRHITQKTAAVAAVAGAVDLGSSSGRGDHNMGGGTTHSASVKSSTAAGADAGSLSAYSSMRSTPATSQRMHSLQSSISSEAVGAAAAGQQLLLLQSAATDQLPRAQQWAAASSQSAGSSSGNEGNNSSSRRPIEGLGGLDPKHIEQSLRSRSINSQSGNSSTVTGRSWSDSSSSGVPASNPASRPLSLAASRAQSIGRDVPSPGLLPARTNSSAATTTASAAAAAAAAQMVRSSSDSGWGTSRPASRQAAVAAVEPLQLQLLTSAPDRLSQQQQQQQQRSDGLSRSPSKRAAAALVAQGLARQPSRSSSTTAAAQGQSYTRTGSLKWDGEASPAAMQSDACNVRVPASLEKSAAPSAAPSQLTSTAGSRSLSRQISRAAAAPAAASGVQMPAAAAGEARESVFCSSSSDEDDERGTVGMLGGIGSISTNSRRSTGALHSASLDGAMGNLASSGASSIVTVRRPRSSSELQYMAASGLSVSGRSRSSNSMNIAEGQKETPAGVRSATGAAAIVTESAGIGSVSSSIGSLNSTYAREQSRRRLSDGQHSASEPQAPERQRVDSSNSNGGYSRSNSGNSRAKLLVSSSQGGYDAQKLQKSLSAKSRQLQQQQPAADTAATVVAPLSARRRAMSATGSGSAAGSTLGSTTSAVGMIHSSSTNVLLERLNQTELNFSGAVSNAATGQQPHRASTGTPYLKPALSRAARVAGVMASGRGALHSSVSFKEPLRSSLEGSMSKLSTSPDVRTEAEGPGQTAKVMPSTSASDPKAVQTTEGVAAAASTDGVGGEKTLLRSSSRQQQAVLQKAARLMEASDSD